MLSKYILVVINEGVVTLGGAVVPLGVVVADVAEKQFVSVYAVYDISVYYRIQSQEEKCLLASASKHSFTNRFLTVNCWSGAIVTVTVMVLTISPVPYALMTAV